MSPYRLLARLAAVAAIVALVLQPGAAAAHEGQGQFAVETTEPTAAGVRYVARLTWVNDNHPAIDATVTATPVDPAGTAGTSVVFTAVDQDGRYQGEVPLPAPGTWTVRFTAVTPAASTEVTHDVTAPTTTPRPASPASAGPSDPPTTTESAAPASPAGDNDGGSAGTVVFVVVLAAIVAVGALAYRSARRRPVP